MESHAPRTPLLAVILGVSFALMWSSAFTSARILVAEAPPLLTLAARFALSGVIALVLARGLGQTGPMTRTQWALTAVFGLCQNALYLGLYFVAMQTVPASVAAITASAMPLLVALMGWAAFGHRLRPGALAGLVAGFAGVGLILGTRLTGGGDPLGLLLCGLGVTALALATLVMRGASSGGNLMQIVGLQMLVGSAALWPVGLWFERWDVSWTPQLVGAFAYTTLVPGLAATFVWFLLVERIGAVRAAAFHFLNPVFGVAIAAVVLREPLGPWDAVGVAVTTAGIVMVQRAQRG